MKNIRHSWFLVLILLVGAALRFWNLDAKPLWLDEVITAIFSLGRSFNDVPLDRAFPISELAQVFTLKPETTCAQIAETVATQSVHPPLFFCWMHHWMTWVNHLPASWVWKLRAFSALVGVGAIAALYQLNRIAFSPNAGLMGAALMAVSPFAVYLSQEARHYTLPMLLVILALMGLYQIHLDLYQQRFRPVVWLGWVAVNSMGFYVHYFFLLTVVAQVAALVVTVLSLQYLPALYPSPPVLNLRRSGLAIALATLGIGLAYLPWLPTFVGHMSRPETDWLAVDSSNWASAVAPLYRLPMGWILMWVALPVETQSLWVAVPMVVVTVVFAGWLIWQVWHRFGKLWVTPASHLVTRMLVVFLLTVVLEFLAIVYLLGKDITLVPRYNFIYFPAVCALLGASLVQRTDAPTLRAGANRSGIIFAVLLMGTLSSVLVVSNQVFQKPYYPNQVATQMQSQTAMPLLATLAYLDAQDIALGLSFALALEDAPNRQAEDYFALLSRSRGYEQVWQTLRQLPHPLTFPLDLWVIGPGLRQAEFPPQLALMANGGSPVNCPIDPSNYYRLGVPYQRYQCGAKAAS
jgi:uncharacterized membrane protein